MVCNLHSFKVCNFDLCWSPRDSRKPRIYGDHQIVSGAVRDKKERPTFLIKCPLVAAKHIATGIIWWVYYILYYTLHICLDLDLRTARNYHMCLTSRIIIPAKGVDKSQDFSKKKSTPYFAHQFTAYQPYCTRGWWFIYRSSWSL